MRTRPTLAKGEPKELRIQYDEDRRFPPDRARPDPSTTAWSPGAAMVPCPPPDGDDWTCDISAACAGLQEGTATRHYQKRPRVCHKTATANLDLTTDEIMAITRGED